MRSMRSVRLHFGLATVAVLIGTVTVAIAATDENNPASCVTPNCGDCTVQQLADGSCVVYKEVDGGAFTFKTCKYDTKATSPCNQTSTKQSMTCGASSGNTWSCNNQSQDTCDFTNCNCGSTNPKPLNPTQNYYTCN
jgi:hypothetical protein